MRYCLLFIQGLSDLIFSLPNQVPFSTQALFLSTSVVVLILSSISFISSSHLLISLFCLSITSSLCLSWRVLVSESDSDWYPSWCISVSVFGLAVSGSVSNPILLCGLRHSASILLLLQNPTPVTMSATSSGYSIVSVFTAMKGFSLQEPQ